MRALVTLFAMILTNAACAVDDGWARAVGAGTYEFPRDHYSHPDFKTEWWYFTGHLEGEDGRQFGFQVTIFRQGVRPARERGGNSSELIVDHLYFAHLALSDIREGELLFSQEVARGSFGEAGANESPGAGEKLAWLGKNVVTLKDDGSFHLDAVGEGWELDLDLTPAKSPAFNGIDGCSQKGPGEGNASRYYSYTRLVADGSLRLRDEELRTTGLAWFDREWSTSALGADQVGWDWFSLQFDDGSELMIYQLRREDGSASPFSSGTFVPVEGEAQHLSHDDFSLSPLRHWQSKVTPGKYPVEWEVAVPSLGIECRVAAEFDSQEMALLPVAYWEGAVRADGSRSGRGYVEMTGYAGALGELR